MPVVTSAPQPLLALRGVGRTVDGNDILHNVDWDVRSGENWVVLGPNGSGKTTLAKIAALRLHPTVGEVEVLGSILGKTDIRPLLGHLGYAAAALSDQLRPELSNRDVVMTAVHGALEPWWHEYDDADRQQAIVSLERAGVAHLAQQSFGSCSSGEKQRVLIARALMTNPSLLVLDEPTAALDLAGREAFVASLDRIADEPDAPPIVLITHHVDEIASCFTHVLLMADGTVVNAGPIETTLTEANLRAAFAMDLRLEERHGRWWAWAERSDSDSV